MTSITYLSKYNRSKSYTSVILKLSLVFIAFITTSFNTYTTTTQSSNECENGISAALGYNAFVQYGVSVSNGDTEGPMAMGGDLTLNGTFTVAAHTGGSYYHNGESQASSLVVNGKIIYKSNQGINLNQGFVKIGDLTGSNVYDIDNNNVTTNTRITPGGYDQSPRIHLQRNQAYSSVNSGSIIDFDAAFAKLNAASAAYSQLVNNVTIENGNKITLANNTVNVLNVTGNELNNLTNFTFNNKPTTDSPLIINVNYTGDFSWNVQNQAGIGDQQGAFIIYNFYNSSKITINDNGATIMGTVLAPSSDVIKKTSGNINGQLIAKTYEHLNGELHQHTYNHCEEQIKVCELTVDAGNKKVTCEGSQVTLTASTTGSDCVNNITYTWSGPGIVGDTNQASITADTAGTYTVKVQDCDDCIAEDTVIVKINNNPKVSVLANNTSCTAEQGSIVFSFEDYKSRSHIKLSIDGGATYTKVKDNIGSYTFNGLEANTYPISIKWGNNQCPVNLEAVIIEELQSMTVEAGENQEICSGESITLTAQVDEVSTNQCTEAIEFLWSTGETTNSITVSPNESTVYSVTASNCGNCTAEDTVAVTIIEVPEAIVVATDTTCEQTNGNITFTFSDVDQRTTIDLSIDGGATYTTVNDNIASYTFDNLATGTYSTAIQWSNQDCAVNLNDVVIIEGEGINVDAGQDQEICAGEEVTLTAQVEGEGTCSTCVEYNLTDTDYCRGDHNFVVYVNDLGVRLWFSNVDLKWAENEDGSATLKGTVFEYNTTNTYFTVDATYSGKTTQPPVDSPKDNFCQSEDSSGWIYYTELTGSVTQIDGALNYTISRRGPAFQLGAGANVYESGDAVNGGSGWFNIEGEPTSFGDFNINLADCISSESNGFEYLWSTGETTQSITVSPTENTTYSVSVTNCADCVAEDTVAVSIQESPVVTLDSEGSTCSGNDGYIDFYFVDSAEKTSIDLSIDGGVTYTTVNDNLEYFPFDDLGAGSYDIVVRYDSDSCPVSLETIILEEGAPAYNVDAGTDQEICAGDSTTLTAQVTGNTGTTKYLWSNGETTQSITVSPSETTSYSVTVTSCTIINTPIIPNTSIIAFPSTSNNDDNDDENEPITGPVNMNCNTCPVSDTVTVNVSKNTVDAGDDVSIDFGESQTLTVSPYVEGTEYLWSTGETTPSITVSPNETSTYTVTATNEKGCPATDSVTVNVAIDPCLSQVYNVVAYPIPVDALGVLNIDIAIDRDQVVNYTIYRMNASMIGDSIDVNLPKGCNTINVDLVEHCSFGANSQYILVVTGDNWSETLNFITLP